jgi:hypothetical protein
MKINDHNGNRGQGPGFRDQRSKKSEMDNLFLKSVYCLSGLGIVRKNRRIPKHFTNRYCLFQGESIVFILQSVFSLRSFNHEFTRFEKKTLSMERFNK